MIRKMFSLFLSILIVTTSVVNVCGAGDTRKSTEAAYGTPVIDGSIDDVWSKTNANIVTDVKSKAEDSYKGWFKVLWDNENLYVLGYIYSPQCDNSDDYVWNHDSMEIFVDEHCDRTETYGTDDYQIRVGYDSNVSGANYDLTKVCGAGTETDDGFIVEMAVPMLEVNPGDGMVMGFDVQINSSATLTLPTMQYAWNAGDGRAHADTSVFGTLTLKDTVNVGVFNEPQYTVPNSGTSFGGEVVSDGEYQLLTDVTTKFDDKAYHYPILLINDYPCMEIGELAKVIEGSVQGNTLIKDDVGITYTEGSRLASYGNGHLMLERKPTVWDGRLYVPVSSLMTTLLYHIEYRRFDNLLEIITGTNYPTEIEKTVYAKDYGAVGDGVHDDKDAILKAFHAAIGSGVPSQLILEENKTYFVSERVDCASFFDLDNVQNFTLEGNGSKILFERPTNGFVSVRDCANIKIKNLSAEWLEHTSTQGRITEINLDEEYIVLDIDEGFPLPADDEWVKYYNSTHGFGILFDPEEPHLKFIPVDHYMIDKTEPVEGRKYKITISHSQAGNMKYMETGDRFVIKTAFKAYDFAKAGTDGAISAVYVFKCKDITFEGVTVYGSLDVGASVGQCTGRITFRNYKMLTKEGALLSSNADGISAWLNRAGMVIENCVLEANGDDHINTKGTAAKIKNQIDEYTFEGDTSLLYERGDELMFIEPNGNTVLGTAFVKEVNGNTVVVDRPIEGVTTTSGGASLPTCIFNVQACNKGSVIRGNTFTNSRRHAYMPKTPNSIFEDNKVINNAGCMIQAMNEIVAAWQEGTFPSSFTMRNNIVESDGMTSTYLPVEVCVWNSKIGDVAYIDGFLMENNIIDVPSPSGAMKIDSVTDLYMINNTLRSDGAVKNTTRPVTITNSSIALIDGLNFEWKEDVKSVLSIAGCKYDESDIKNINISGEKTAEPYYVE